MFVLCVCVCVCVCAVCVCTSSAAARAPTEDGPKADNLRHTLQVLCGQVLHTSTRAHTHTHTHTHTQVLRGQVHHLPRADLTSSSEETGGIVAQPQGALHVGRPQARLRGICCGPLDLHRP